MIAITSIAGFISPFSRLANFSLLLFEHHFVFDLLVVSAVQTTSWHNWCYPLAQKRPVIVNDELTIGLCDSVRTDWQGLWSPFLFPPVKNARWITFSSPPVLSFCSSASNPPQFASSLISPIGGCVLQLTVQKPLWALDSESRAKLRGDGPFIMRSWKFFNLPDSLAFIPILFVICNFIDSSLTYCLSICTLH